MAQLPPTNHRPLCYILPTSIYLHNVLLAVSHPLGQDFTKSERWRGMLDIAPLA